MTIGSSAVLTTTIQVILTAHSMLEYFLSAIRRCNTFGGIQPEKGQVIQQGTNVTLFKCTDPMEELAGWLFIRFLTGYKAAMIWATKTGYFPIRNSVRTSQEYEDFLSVRNCSLMPIQASGQHLRTFVHCQDNESWMGTKKYILHISCIPWFQ